MYKTLIDYNDRNNASLFNQKIQEAIYKYIKQELDANNVPADTFSHTSNTQIKNANAIFTSEKLDKSDELEDTLKDLTISNAEYYVSKSENENVKKGNPKKRSKDSYSHW